MLKGCRRGFLCMKKLFNTWQREQIKKNIPNSKLLSLFDLMLNLMFHEILPVMWWPLLCLKQSATVHLHVPHGRESGDLTHSIVYSPFWDKSGKFWLQTGHAFHTPAVVQQEAEQAEQDEGHASEYSQQKHGVVHADVLRKHRTWWTDKKLGKERKSKSWAQ